MQLARKTQYGIFIRRDSRFSATVKVGHRLVKAYVPNTGRLGELLGLSHEVLLKKSYRPKRKTKVDLILVRFPNILISVDSRVPNKLFHEVFQKKKLKYFKKYSELKTEPRYGHSRLDFLLSRKPTKEMDKPGDYYYLEVKSVTLVEEQTALFPDAPTERGTKHLKDLMQAKKEGYGAGILFIVQRKDARKFKPNDVNDPIFGKTLRQAAKSGVDIFAYTCRVTDKEISLNKKIPVHL